MWIKNKFYKISEASKQSIATKGDGDQLDQKNDMHFFFFWRKEKPAAANPLGAPK